MALITKPYTFSNGATIIASEHNSNLDTLYNLVNGGLDTANLSPTALIALSQISFSQAITMTGNITMSGAITKWAKGADVASAAGSITLGDDGNIFDITGTEAITSIIAKTAGTVVILQFDSTASLVDGSNLSLNGDFQGAASSVIMLFCDGTTWFEISRSPVSYTQTASGALAGSVVQTVNYQTGSVSTGSTVIPLDDSIPQNSEGDEYMTLAITPNSATNKLKIDVVFCASLPNNIPMVTALFKDSTANALAAVADWGSYVAEQPHTITFTHYMTSGTTSEITFKVRSGPTSAGTITFNGISSGRLFGGICASSITITEIKV